MYKERNESANNWSLSHFSSLAPSFLGMRATLALYFVRA